VILEQSPNYDDESDVVRPRGRAARLHPDAPPITRSKQRELEAQQRAAELASELEQARTREERRTLWVAPYADAPHFSDASPSDAG